MCCFVLRPLEVAASKKGHRRCNSHGHIGQASIPTTTATTKIFPPTSPTITISMADPTPNPPPHIPHSKTDPCLSEFDPLMSKQRSNSDESPQRLLNVTDASGSGTPVERPRSGSLGGEGAPLMLPASISAESEGQQMNRPPEKPMRSVSLDQRVSQSKGR